MLYESILTMARIYKKDNQDPLEIANQCYLEFVEGNYQQVYDGFPEAARVPFIRSFVKKRCWRELTRAHKYYPVEDLSYLPSEDTPYTEFLQEQEVKTERLVLASLKEQEQLVVDLLLEKATRRDIAKVLGRSLGTVQNIIERIKKNPEVVRLYEEHYQK